MAEPKTRVIIAEDHKLFREGLISLLDQLENFVVLAEAENGLEAIRCTRKHQPELLLLDLSMPRMNGISVIKEIKSQFPAIKILALTIHQDEQYVLEAFKSGVDGYCLKDAGRNELRLAIDSIMTGKRYISPTISGSILNGYLSDRNKDRSRSSWDTLTQREREVLKLVGEGYLNKAIAELLCISVKTVEKHRSNIMKKLDLHNASGLTAYAIEHGLVMPKP
jgi:DNA-binding NarL/FixJ family response regulator